MPPADAATREDVLARYEPVIGLEVHCQLLTRTKIFCGCPNRFGGEPNTLVCPVCLGLPGALPVLSREAVLLALRERWGAIEDARSRWFRDLPDDGVSRRIAYKTLAGNPGEAPLWQLIQHVANHATYHRGQAVFMLKLLGATPAATDLVLWDREKLALKEREKAGLVG